MSFSRSHSRLVFNFHIMLLGSVELDKANWLRKAMGEPDRLKVSPIAIGKNIPLDTGEVELVTRQCSYGFHFVNTSNDPRYRVMIKAHMRNKDAYFVFYTRNNRQSFDAIASYVREIRGVNPGANIILIDVAHAKLLEVEQREIDRLLDKLKLHFICRVDLARTQNELLAPLHYMINYTQAKRINVPLDLSACVRMVNEARRYCWDENRMVLLDNFKDKLRAFSELSHQSDSNKFTLMKQQCDEVMQAVENILASAQPESVRMAVYFAGATALLVTAVVCGILLISVAMLLVLTSILVSGCVIAATCGSGLLAAGIYKAKENSIYSSIESATKAALAVFPK